MVINICLIKGATEERGGWEKEAKWKWDFVQKYLDQTPVWKLSIETLQVMKPYKVWKLSGMECREVSFPVFRMLKVKTPSKTLVTNSASSYSECKYGHAELVPNTESWDALHIPFIILIFHRMKA